MITYFYILLLYMIMAVQRDIRFRNRASISGYYITFWPVVGRSGARWTAMIEERERERPLDHRSFISQFQIIVRSDPVCLSTKDLQELDGAWKCRRIVSQILGQNCAMYSTHDKIQPDAFADLQSSVLTKEMPIPVADNKLQNLEFCTVRVF